MQQCPMRIQKFSDGKTFVAIDLPGTPTATGIVRLAPKILQGGAKDLARSLTYSYACLGLEVSGASAGISAPPEERDEAVARFVSELAEQDARWFHVDAGKGVDESDLAALRDGDPRHPGSLDAAAAIRVAGIVAAVDHVVDDLSAATIATDVTWDTDVLAALTAAGATVAETDDPYAADVDVLLTGAKTGVVDHTVAERITAKAICPVAPLPITAKAFAALRRAGTIVLPDFVTLAAVPAASFAAADLETGELAQYGAAAVTDILDEVIDHDEGPYLGACLRAEAFLGTWQEQLPFGRPFAA